MSAAPNLLLLEPLTRESFAPFGDVIEIAGSASYPINHGTTQRFHDLGQIQILGDNARAAISMARGDAFHYPLTIAMLERHPLGSQAWIPCNGTPFVVVVAPNGADDRPDETAVRGFFAQGTQGVNYHAGTWHHPLMSLGQSGDFIVVDRIGNAPNCDECDLRLPRVVNGCGLFGDLSS